MVLTEPIRNAGPVARAALLAVTLIAIPLIAGYLGHYHQALDSFSHFRVYLAFLIIAASLPLFVTDLIKIGALAAGFGILSIATTSGNVPAPGIGPGYGPLYAATGDAPTYTLLQLNLRYDNQQKEKVLSLIGRVLPDVITLDEVTDEWAQRLKTISAAYPNGVICPHPYGIWSVAILSRRPFIGDKPVCNKNGSFATIPVDFGGQSVEVAALHLGWPWPFDQRWQIDAVSPFLDKLGPVAIMAGDMNATPWSETVRRIARAGRLDLMPSPGPTWIPLGTPEALRFAGLPIDQVFASPGIKVHDVSRLEAVGSDHLPLLVQFSLAPDPKPKGDGETATALADDNRRG